jgi:hypothetical protein
VEAVAQRRAASRKIGRPMSSEPQFEAYRKRVLTGSLVLCIAAVPIGLILRLPNVWILGIVGIVVAGWKLRKIREREQERK